MRVSIEYLLANIRTKMLVNQQRHTIKINKFANLETKKRYNTHSIGIHPEMH